MNTYIILLRGINVGGKNKLPMAELKQFLTELGFERVTTYIQSGNVILKSDQPADTVRRTIETRLPKKFKLDSELIKILVMTRQQLQQVVDHKPRGFGDEPEKYHSDVVFLMEIETAEAMLVFKPKDGVDQVWPGKSVIYSQRLSAKRTQSHLSKIVGTPAYKCMTIRNWNTTTKLLEMAQTF